MSRKKMQKELFEAEREQRYLEATTKAKKSGLSKPGHGLLPFLMQAEQEETSVTGRAGLPLVVETFRGHRGDDLVRELIKVKKRHRGFSEVEMIEDHLLLLASGGEHVEDFEVLQSLAFLETRLELRLLRPKIPRGRRRVLEAPA